MNRIPKNGGIYNIIFGLHLLINRKTSTSNRGHEHGRKLIVQGSPFIIPGFVGVIYAGFVWLANKTHLTQLFWTGGFAHLMRGGFQSDGYSRRVTLQ